MNEEAKDKIAEIVHNHYGEFNDEVTRQRIANDIQAAVFQHMGPMKDITTPEDMDEYRMVYTFRRPDGRDVMLTIDYGRMNITFG